MEDTSATEFGVAPYTADWYYCAIVEWRGRETDTDYIDGYASGSAPTIKGLREFTACRHVWVGGMCYVHEEDLAAVAASGRRIECENCDAVYGEKEPQRFKVLEWEVKATPHGKFASTLRSKAQQ